MRIAGFVLVFVLLLLLNAFFVLAEFAAVRIRGSRIEEMVDGGDPRARLVQHVHANLDEYLSVCQVGITFASVALGFVGERAAAQLLMPLLTFAGAWSAAFAHAVATVASVCAVSFLHILLGEQVPKLVAIRMADRAALATAKPLRWSRWAFYLPLWLLNWTSHLVLRALGVSEAPAHEQVSEDELRIILERSQSGGLMSFRRLLFMENIFDLGGLKVKDAMRPRAQVKTLARDLSPAAAAEAVRQWRFSRFPVVGEDPEKPLGYVHVKDLFLAEHAASAPPTLAPLVRPFLATSEQTPLELVLAEMQRRRGQVALVQRDAGWSGIITMEDIVEEIIGTVGDEFETDPPVTLAEALRPGRILLDVEGLSIVDATRQALARVAPAELPAPAETILRAVAERERLASTYLSRGLAMPHARLPLATPAFFLLRAPRGIPVEGTTEKAKLLFVLVTPAGQPRVHQRLQARLAALLEKSDYVEERLHTAATPAEMYEVVRTGEQAAID